MPAESRLHSRVRLPPLFFSPHSAILADEMGLGKTVQAVSTINYLYKTYNLRGPYLVVAERHPPYLGLNIDRIRKSA